VKKSAVKAGLVVLVLVGVVLWTFLSNHFLGAVNSEVVVDKRDIDSQFCRAQFQEVLRIPDGKAFRQAWKKNQAFMDKKCFLVSESGGLEPNACFVPPVGNSAIFGNNTESDVYEILCGAFLTYSKYMLTDYYNADVSDLKSMPDDILRAKLSAHFVPREKPNPQLMELLANEVLRRAPDELKALKLYIIAQYLLPGRDFSKTGAVYPYITKAYKLAPRDKEIQEFVAYSVMVSDRGLFKLTELEFLIENHYSYYFYAWFHWKYKTSLEKVKAHLITGHQKSKKYKYLFEDTAKQVADKKTVFGQDNVFHLSFEPMPPWGSL